MDNALEEFATSDTAARQLSALRALAQSKALSHAAKTQPFADGVRVLGTILTQDDPLQRLYALAALGRVWSSVKQQRSDIERLISTTAVKEPAPLLQLADADERAYAAMAAGMSRQSWVLKFGAAGAVAEESGEEARTACVRAVLSATNNLTQALTLFRDRLAALSFQTERPSDSMARRVRRLLSSLHDEIAAQRRLPAEGAGATLGRLLYDSFRHIGPPTRPPVKRELVAAVSEVVHDIVRTRFAQATESSTYDSLDFLSRWFAAHEWEELVASLPQAEAIAEDLVEATTLLAKAGLTDDRMRAALCVALGSERNAAERLKSLAGTVPGLNDAVRNWLMGTASVEVLDAVEESASRKIDQIVAAVLVRRGTMEELKKQPATSSYDVTVRAMIDALLEVARARSLELAYAPGDTMDYSPLDHDLVGGARLGIRRITIVHPQVRAQQPNGTYRVVRKALVEPIAE